MNLAELTVNERQKVVDSFYWYQSIAFGDGVASRGTVDHAPWFDTYGFPSVAGRSVLDVGASDGYFSFAFERQGAARVLATDIDRWQETPNVDLPVRTRAQRLQKFVPRAGEEDAVRERARVAAELGFERPNAFYLARALLKSAVPLRYLSVYDLPTLGERFDLVFLGTVTTHLADLPVAFEALRAVTARQAVVACADLPDFEQPRGGRRLALHAIRVLRMLGRLDDHVVIARESPAALFTANTGGAVWRPTATCVREMLLSAGFSDVHEHTRFVLPNLRRGTDMTHVVFHAFA
jgi:SAM-dependent methyltransferase